MGLLTDVVAEISIKALDEASPVFARVGESAKASAAEMEAANAKVAKSARLAGTAGAESAAVQEGSFARAGVALSRFGLGIGLVSAGITAFSVDSASKFEDGLIKSDRQ